MYSSSLDFFSFFRSILLLEYFTVEFAEYVCWLLFKTERRLRQRMVCVKNIFVFKKKNMCKELYYKINLHLTIG